MNGHSAYPLDGASSQLGLPSFARQDSHLSAPAWAPSAADRIYQAFDVSQPVDQPQDLRGRAKQVARLLSGVIHRRNHGIVSGPRGSGKTSLVRVFGQYADREGIVVLYAACDGGTTFGELLRGYLEQIPPSSVDPDEVELFDQRVLSFGLESSPHQATSIFAQIKYSQVVIVLDEFDRVFDPVLQAKVASLLKLISDARLPVRFVLVGGNNAFLDVVREHPSLMRHVTRVSTAPLAREAVFELLDSCADRCGMQFSAAGRELLDEVACGSPYHARLFGMHAALAALRGGDIEISQQAVAEGLYESFEEWSSLNGEDSATFHAICSGARGDPAPFVELAGRIATATDDEQLVDRPAPDPQAVEAAFGSAIDRSAEPIAFRDATAPQYLIALHHLSRLSSREQKGTVRA
ncbi:ATP-binding protein [uncultured Sphingomonas sp.]|uniref:ATP-binding protein n=1 Tax=uncultured Sphingomonas sp. TaxID=158754 RepID=UPI0025D2C80E|nr:ATP-binding protein [uncultured Sphingomonas sp.]